jgi:hypothetical protein
MSLYINQINEALREDQDIKSELVRRMKRNYQDNTEKMLETTMLSNSALGLIQSYIDKFQKSIYLLNDNLRRANTLGTLTLGEETQIAEVVQNWNALCGLFRNLLFSKLNKGQQAPIIAKIKRVLPTLPVIIANFEEIFIRQTTDNRYTADTRNLEFLIELQRNIEASNFMPLGIPFYDEKTGKTRLQEHKAVLADDRDKQAALRARQAAVLARLAAQQPGSEQASPASSPPESDDDDFINQLYL